MAKRDHNSKNARSREEQPDSLVKTIEDRYKVRLHSRSDAELDTVLRRYGASVLSQVLKEAHGK